MGMNYLQDLSLAGVRWELADNNDEPAKPEPTQQTQDNKNATVIAPRAPVKLGSAETAVADANDTMALLAAIAGFNHPLRQFVKNVILPHLVPGKLLIITDSPSGEDDDSGKVLSGPAGALMDKMLGAMGLSRENVSILPLVFWRAPGGRSPAREELDLARPFVNKAIELLNPSVILTLGSLAAGEIAGLKLPSDHGNTTELNGTTVMPIYHPNYLLLKPDAKKPVWDALQKILPML